MIDFDFTPEGESDIESAAANYAKRRGWFVVKLMKCNISGMPDRLFHRKGFTIYIEFKAPGGQLSAQQIKRHKELRKHGIPVHVVDNLEAARAILQ